MADTTNRSSLGEQAAYQLANVTKTAPIYGAVTPRWLVRLLDWKPLKAGIFRRNRVVEDKPIDVLCGHADDSEIPETYADYEETPREYRLSHSTLPNGTPDTGFIARIANELFAALPGSLDVPSMPVDAGKLSPPA